MVSGLACGAGAPRGWARRARRRSPKLVSIVTVVTEPLRRLHGSGHGYTTAASGAIPAQAGMQGGADVTRSTGKYAARPPGLGPTAQPRPGVAGAAGVAGRLRTRGRVRPDLRNRRRDARSRAGQHLATRPRRAAAEIGRASGRERG